MPSTKPLLWISTFALLAACDSGSPIAPPQEPRPEAIASGPSCIAAHADTPCRLLTPELVKQAHPDAPDTLDIEEIPSLNSCAYSWPSDRTRTLKVSTFEVETPVPNRVAISWIRQTEPERALEQFQLTYRSLSDKEKAEALTAMRAQLDKQGAGLPEEQRSLASDIGKELIETSRFEPVAGVGSTAAWDAGSLGNSLKVLDRDTEFGIEVNVSAEPEENRELAIAVAKQVLATCR
ncbi:MAG: hypothetical protein WC247_14085 [Porticoccaceae bacterium]